MDAAPKTRSQTLRGIFRQAMTGAVGKKSRVAAVRRWQGRRPAIRPGGEAGLEYENHRRKSGRAVGRQRPCGRPSREDRRMCVAVCLDGSVRSPMCDVRSCVGRRPRGSAARRCGQSRGALGPAGCRTGEDGSRGRAGPARVGVGADRSVPRHQGGGRSGPTAQAIRDFLPLPTADIYASSVTVVRIRLVVRRKEAVGASGWASRRKPPRAQSDTRGHRRGMAWTGAQASRRLSGSCR